MTEQELDGNIIAEDDEIDCGNPYLKEVFEKMKVIKSNVTFLFSRTHHKRKLIV